MKLDPEKGVVGVQQLPTIEIERHEVGVSQKISVDITKELDKDKKALHFTWKNKNMEFQSWEIAHFRLLGDDRKLPYGTSMLEKARRTWKPQIIFVYYMKYLKYYEGKILNSYYMFTIHFYLIH